MSNRGMKCSVSSFFIQKNKEKKKVYVTKCKILKFVLHSRCVMWIRGVHNSVNPIESRRHVLDTSVQGRRQSRWSSWSSLIRGTFRFIRLALLCIDLLCNCPLFIGQGRGEGDQGKAVNQLRHCRRACRTSPQR